MGFIEILIAFSNSSILSKTLQNKSLINPKAYIDINRKRHFIAGIINILISIFFYLSMDKYESLVILIGFLVHIFNILFFHSKTQKYLKDAT